jgi:RNA polymerase sigma factor (TIGR02999 family)
VTAPSTEEITGLLRRWSGGDARALDQLIPIVYEQLRRLAHRRLRGEGNGTLDTTGLVHEAYLKLVNAPDPDLHDRSHFLALASRVMRNVLVDHARARKAAKRGGGAVPLVLDDPLAWIPDRDLELYSDMDAALARLEAMDPRQGRILEQRYFGGLSLEETADALGLSLATVKRELRSARAWLAGELGARSAAG